MTDGGGQVLAGWLGEQETVSSLRRFSGMTQPQEVIVRPTRRLRSDLGVILRWRSGPRKELQGGVQTLRLGWAIGGMSLMFGSSAASSVLDWTVLSVRRTPESRCRFSPG